jgi:DTW domain-containing protein YfiP
VCHWTRPTDNRTSVLILQHPQERHHVKNSAGLLLRSLTLCRREVGEVFDAAQLSNWIGPMHSAALLYPSTGPGPEASAQPTQVRTLVVIDATWRKSLRMLASNPVLQSLPRLALQDTPAPRYSIRRARQAHQLSTLEACCQALGELEGQPARYAALLAAFDGFVAEQARWMAGLPPSRPPLS